ncbi:MAG: acetate kinase [bacterium]|nr:acetate kinase [bacterium]
MQILVLNCGSSSVKYQLYNMADETVLCGGVVEKIGQPDATCTHIWGAQSLSEPVQANDHTRALAQIRDLLLNPNRGGVQHADDIAAVGHRVVHGGETFVSATRITTGVERQIAAYNALAPLHNPPNLTGIQAARQCFPNAIQVAVFDTAFHQTLPEHAFLYPIPYALYEKDRIRKYGFHGTSHRYVSHRAAELLEKSPDTFTGITCHLGNGCSITAIQNGQSVDTSMGFTPLEGVPMGTRSGDVDPALILYLADQKGLTIAEIGHLLNRESGLLGLSGISNDLRELESTTDPRAQLAQTVFAYRIRKYIGAYLSILPPIDALVFTGGIGENSASMRAHILQDLNHLGIVLDPERNRQLDGEGEISTPNAPIRILVIPTDEERLIARETLSAVKEQND